ncbi:MAG: TMEM175 family protein [Flavobacteriales bacterium]|nr:TMEM175 family protein [Flavobacteriales bacterium]
MNKTTRISTGRLEAFSDGVIAIIITVMVFDLKLQEIPTDNTVWDELLKLVPKLISYAISFLMLAIMWVNHHQLFHQIKRTDNKLLWYNIHLLFWMSLIPFGTHFIGANPWLWQSSLFYGVIFFMNALSFTLIRNYVIENDILLDSINKKAHIKIRNKNRLALFIYFLAAIFSLISVYIAFAMFLMVPAMYFKPDNNN